MPDIPYAPPASNEQATTSKEDKCNPLFMEVQLGQDLDMLGNKVRIIYRAFQALKTKQEQEMAQVLSEIEKLRIVFATHELDENAWRTKLDKRFDDQLALLQELSTRIIHNDVQEVSHWKDSVRYWSVAAVGMTCLILIARKEVGDTLVTLGSWFAKP